jgi:hypothetical protein
VKGAGSDDCATEAPCSVPHLTDKALFFSLGLFIPGKNWDLRIVESVVQKPDSAIHGIMNFLTVIKNFHSPEPGSDLTLNFKELKYNSLKLTVNIWLSNILNFSHIRYGRILRNHYIVLQYFLIFHLRHQNQVYFVVAYIMA